MGIQVMQDTGDPRYDEVPDGFVSAAPKPLADGRCPFRMEATTIPLAELQAVGERMGIAVEDREGVTMVTFPAPYDQALRQRWCMNVRTLAIHHDVDWPHLRDA